MNWKVELADRSYHCRVCGVEFLPKTRRLVGKGYKPIQDFFYCEVCGVRLLRKDIDLLRTMVQSLQGLDIFYFEKKVVGVKNKNE
jgi:rubredoxin